jgi:hypothetical protein
MQMQDAKETIAAAEIADLLHMKTETFLKRRRKLEAEGMPRSIPGTSHPPVWSRALFLAWIDTRHGAEPETSAPEEASEGADYVANTRRALEARAGIGAGQ